MKHNWKLDEYGKPDEWACESGYHNGVYCEDCGKSPCIHCDPDWYEMDDCTGPPKRKPMTNADLIRARNDHELADMFSSFICDINEGVEYSDNPNRWLEWLQRPAEVANES